MKPLKWRAVIITLLSFWAIYTVSPTLIYFYQPKEIRNDEEQMAGKTPSWLPQDHVKLGLDLQGGVALVLGVDTRGSVENRLNLLAVEIMRWAEDKDLGLKNSYVKKGSGRITIELKEGVAHNEFNSEIRKEYNLLSKIERKGQTIYYGFPDSEISRIEKSAVEQAERTIRNRVDHWGVSEPNILRRADNSILVQLPGFKDPQRAREFLGKTAELKFKIVDDKFDGFKVLKDLPEGIKRVDDGAQVFRSEDRAALIELLQPLVPDDRELLFEKKTIGDGSQAKYRWTSYVVHAATMLTGSDIQDARVVEGGAIDRRPEVSLTMTALGGKRFGQVTGDNVNKRLAIILDDEIVSAPNISEKIPSGRASISLGAGNREEAIRAGTELALILKSGAIPATINILSQTQVGASLGPELANQGIKGILVGLSLVLLFMLIYYRKPGTIACFALVLNALLMLAVMAGFGFTLTLPGIAGFILTLGMAVDANVLINERIHQEIQEGKNPKKSVQSAFDKVFWTIFDANITTLIAALVLLETSGSGPIKAFAITLMIGLLVSLFTSLYCSRFLFDFALTKVSDRKIKSWLLGGEKEQKTQKIKFDFLKVSRPATFVAFFLAIVIVISSFFRGVNLGVDFAGGTEAIVGFSKNIEVEKIRTLADNNSIEGFTAQALEGGKKKYLLRYDETKQEAAQKEAEASAVFLNFKESLFTEFKDYGPEILQVDFVGPQVGKELRTQGMMSVLYAIIAVLLYIAFRFDTRFAPGAIVKMFLDIFLLLGFYVFFEASFDLVAVAAFLTVVGYSVNDTIVIYDRIRENLINFPRRTMRENINISLNETLSRTINTSITTVAALVGILIFASGQIWYFAMAMALGVVIASFTSTFVASSFILWLEEWKDQKRQLSS